MGERSQGGLSSGTEISNGWREHEAKSAGGVEKTSVNPIKVSPNSVMTSGSQPGPWKSNEVSRRCVGSLCQNVGSYRAGRSLSDQAKR